jgi:sortase A
MNSDVAKTAVGAPLGAMLWPNHTAGVTQRIAPGGAPTRSRWTRRRVVAAAIAALALWFALDAGYIHAKAAVAQGLLVYAWEAMRSDGQPHRPWPWADSHPVARLRAPRLDVDQIVLAGDSGRTIAFGPGWAEASAAPGSSGTTVISAHRDTHFDWLRTLQPGDLLVLESPRGERRFRIVRGDVADSRREHLALDADVDQLLLVTCWPFDGVSSGPLRYVVIAVPET